MPWNVVTRGDNAALGAAGSRNDVSRPAETGRSPPRSRTSDAVADELPDTTGAVPLGWLWQMCAGELLDAGAAGGIVNGLGTGYLTVNVLMPTDTRGIPDMTPAEHVRGSVGFSYDCTTLPPSTPGGGKVVQVRNLPRIGVPLVTCRWVTSPYQPSSAPGVEGDARPEGEWARGRSRAAVTAAPAMETICASRGSPAGRLRNMPAMRRKPPVPVDSCRRE